MKVSMKLLILFTSSCAKYCSCKLENTYRVKVYVQTLVQAADEFFRQEELPGFETLHQRLFHLEVLDKIESFFKLVKNLNLKQLQVLSLHVFENRVDQHHQLELSLGNAESVFHFLGDERNNFVCLIVAVTGELSQVLNVLLKICSLTLDYHHEFLEWCHLRRHHMHMHGRVTRSHSPTI